MKTISFSGLSIAHLTGALVMAPTPESEHEREMRWSLLAQCYTTIRDELKPDVRQAIEIRLEELQ